MKTLSLDNYKNMPREVKASFWFLISSFLQRGIYIITLPIYTRIVSTEIYGQFNVFNSWLNVITILVTLQLSAGVYTQGLIKFEEDRAVFSSSLQGLTITLSSLWTIVYFVGRTFWNELLSVSTLQMIAMIVMIWSTAAFSFWAAEQRVKLNYRDLIVVTILLSVLKPLISIIFITLSDDKLTAWILGIALVELVGYSFAFFIHIRHGKKFYSKKFWKYSLAFNLPLVPHYLSQVVLSTSDQIMIKELVGSSEAGIYGLAYQIGLAMTMFNTALMATLAPWIFQKIKERKVYDIQGISYISIILLAVVNILIIAISPELLIVFAPPAYHEAIYVIPPVAASTIFIFCYDLFAKFEFYYEKTVHVMVASIAAACLNVGLNYVCIPFFGYMAAGYTTLFCYIMYAGCHYLFMCRIVKNNFGNKKVYSLKKLALIILVFFAICVVIMLFFNHPIIRYLIVVIISLAMILKKDELIALYKKTRCNK